MELRNASIPSNQLISTDSRGDTPTFECFVDDLGWARFPTMVSTTQHGTLTWIRREPRGVLYGNSDCLIWVLGVTISDVQSQVENAIKERLYCKIPGGMVRPILTTHGYISMVGATSHPVTWTARQWREAVDVDGVGLYAAIGDKFVPVNDPALADIKMCFEDPIAAGRALYNERKNKKYI